MQIKNVIDYARDFKESNLQSLEEILHEIIASRPFGDQKFYIHSFLKDTENINVMRFIHHPRLTKPMPSPNTKLYRVDPKHPEEVEVMWILPGAESMHLFKKGKLFEDEIINDSVREFLKNPKKLQMPEDDDLPDSEIRRIYASKHGKQAFYPFL